MKVIVINIPEEFEGCLGRIVSEGIYQSLCYDNYRVYEVTINDQAYDDAVLKVAREYRPEYLIVILKNSRSIEDLPEDIRSRISQEIKITQIIPDMTGADDNSEI